MRISDWSSDVCSSDLPPVDAVEIVEQQLGPVRVAMQDQRREVEAGEGAEGRGGARNEIGLADRADDAAQCGVGRFHIRSEEHTSELQSLMRISYAVFCLKKKKHQTTPKQAHQSVRNNTMTKKRPKTIEHTKPTN